MRNTWLVVRPGDAKVLLTVDTLCCKRATLPEVDQMAPKPSTPKARALGAALRKARETAGLGVRELARQIDDDPSALSRYEKGERVPKPEKVSQILGSLGVNGSRYESVMALTRDPEGPLWFALSLPEQQHQLQALLEFEDAATEITTVCPLLIPGLVQIRDYTMGMMSADGDIPPQEIRTRVTVRLGRQNILTRPNPVKLLALIGEAALEQLIGTPSVMATQLRYLLEIGQRENVTIRIIPKSSGWHPGLEGLFDLVECEPIPVVQLETRRTAIFLHEEADVDSYRRAVDQVSQVAMSPEDSVGLIADHITRWESV